MGTYEGLESENGSKKLRLKERKIQSSFGHNKRKPFRHQGSGRIQFGKRSNLNGNFVDGEGGEGSNAGTRQTLINKKLSQQLDDLAKMGQDLSNLKKMSQRGKEQLK